MKTIKTVNESEFDRIAEEEARYEVDERARKTCDAACLSNEERFEIQEVQVTEIETIADHRWPGCKNVSPFEH